MFKKPRVIKTEVFYKNQWIKIIKDKIELDKGVEGEYTYISRIDGVCVIVLDNNYTYLVKQYRHPIGKDILELPFEGIEGEESPTEAAKRCTQEELGLEITDLVEIGSTYVDPGLNTQRITFFVAKPMRKTRQNLDVTEFNLVVEKVLISKLDSYIEIKKLDGYPSIVGTYFFKQYLKNNIV